ncbi:hypothetical protein, partial [Acetobacter sp.]|uniref:hypothetical protein n=1 Tax=Acetobacter sp. TaxID=440 RepID=UPI0039E83B81
EHSPPAASTPDAPASTAEQDTLLSGTSSAEDGVEPLPATTPEPKPTTSGHPARLHAMIGQPPPKPMHWALTLISE